MSDRNWWRAVVWGWPDSNKTNAPNVFLLMQDFRESKQEAMKVATREQKVIRLINRHGRVTGIYSPFTRMWFKSGAHFLADLNSRELTYD